MNSRTATPGPAPIKVLHDPIGGGQFLADDLSGLFFGCGHALFSRRPLGAGDAVFFTGEVLLPFGSSQVATSALAGFRHPNFRVQFPDDDRVIGRC